MKLRFCIAYPNILLTWNQTWGYLSYEIFHIFIWLFGTMHIKISLKLIFEKLYHIQK